MKRAFSVIVIMLLATILIAEVKDYIVAKVGREIILRSELDQNIREMRAMKVIREDVGEEQVLDQMIESQLILQKALDENLTVNEEDIRDLVDRRIQQIISNFPSETDFRVELKKIGLTEYDYRKKMFNFVKEQRLREQIVRDEIDRKIHITDAEIEEYYEEHKTEIPMRPASDKLGVIMRSVKAGEKTKTDAKVAIEAALKRVKSGEDFAKVAKEVSDCPSGKDGGDLGFFSRGEMVRAFDQAAFSQIPGEVGKIVETEFGYHIILVEEKKDGKVHARHILKMAQPTDIDRQAELILMEDVLKKLREGADFSEIARVYSQDDSTAMNGGIMGEFPPDRYPEMYADTLKAIGYGQYTDIIQNEDILLIFAKLEAVPERPYKYNEIADNLREQVKLSRQNELYVDLIKKLRKEMYTEVSLKPGAADPIPAE